MVLVVVVNAVAESRDLLMELRRAAANSVDCLKKVVVAKTRTSTVKVAAVQNN